jgi:hypothetical protein
MNSTVGRKILTRDKKTATLKDKVFTPNQVAIDCINYTLPFIIDTDILYEPFSGQDAFYNNFPINNPKEWSEIDRGRDFLESNIKCDWIITNPPYSIWNIIINKIMDSCSKGFCVLVNNLTITPTRLDIINNRGFYISFIYFFTISKWFGRQYYYIFEKRKDKKNLLEMKYRRSEYPRNKIY